MSAPAPLLLSGVSVLAAFLVADLWLRRSIERGREEIRELEAAIEAKRASNQKQEVDDVQR